MTVRAFLCAGLSAASVVLGLATAVVQSDNHERGVALNALKERCSMLEAINSERAAEILARDYAPVHVEPDLPPVVAHHVQRAQGAGRP